MRAGRSARDFGLSGLDRAGASGERTVASLFLHARSPSERSVARTRPRSSAALSRRQPVAARNAPRLALPREHWPVPSEAGETLESLRAQPRARMQREARARQAAGDRATSFRLLLEQLHFALPSLARSLPLAGSLVDTHSVLLCRRRDS